MAVTDLLVITTAVILNRIPAIYFPGSFMFITPVCSFSIALIYACRDSSVWLTVTFTFDRLVAICCLKLKTKYCTEKTAAVVIGMVCVLAFSINIPWYFMHEPVYVIDNTPWFCRQKNIRYTSPLWTAFDWFDRIVTPCLPFFLIVLFNAVTVSHILKASRARKRLCAQRNGENKSDQEMESRRKSIILLFAISGTFIILWMTYVVEFLWHRFAKSYIIHGFDDPKFIFIESGNMLQLLSCCTNSFIYAVTQRKFREQLNIMVKCPLSLIAKLCKK
ncbi:probable G-protein coupled receptor 139 [Rhincodon typus]|uniref:probable G-protein coupled receptor 139 n=1 Tax=Rhincodon typus TaxID=259920 RepID=UPI00202E8F77|nr:probable G-protein coupled receptor 139 [Rhincodon typus]